MNYFLTLDRRTSKKEDNSDRFIFINWQNIIQYQNINTLDLVNICNFTMQFQDYDELYNYLFVNSVVSSSYRGKPFSIIKKKNGKYERIDFGISFAKDKNFFSSINIVNYIQSKKFDIIFLKRLRNRYRNIPPVADDIAYLYNYIMLLEKGIQKNQDIINFNNIILDFVDTICYQKYLKSNSYKTDKKGNVLMNIKPFRDLAMFIVNYENEIEKGIEKIRNSSKEQAHFITNTLTRERILSDYEQLSLFEERK